MSEGGASVWLLIDGSDGSPLFLHILYSTQSQVRSFGRLSSALSPYFFSRLSDIHRMSAEGDGVYSRLNSRILSRSVA
jgi:hypothetical protein